MFFDDDYVGPLEGCELLVIPDTSPIDVGDDCIRMSRYCEKLAAEKVPYLEISLRSGHAAVQSKILEVVNELEDGTRDDVNVTKTLAAIDTYDKQES